ncbi:MAG TPA: V-type ATP synthase subunit E [Methanoregula sp.]|nr:V-type ATP synthase subunit E [Methanoregula sp.]
MAYEDLLKSVEESAREKEAELRKKEAAAVEDIKTRAKKQAAAIRQNHIDEAVRSITAERNKLLYLTKAENKGLLIKTRETAFERAFSGAEARLSALRSSPKYPAIFEKLMREAAGAMGDGVFVVHVDPRDVELCKKTLALLRLVPEIRSDITTAGGMVASLPDNSIVISNTVESRMQRAKELKRKEIHAILTGA